MPSIHCLRCSGASHIGSSVLTRCLQNVGVRRMHNSGEADIFEELGDLPLPTMLFNLCKMKPSEVQMICCQALSSAGEPNCYTFTSHHLATKGCRRLNLVVCSYKRYECREHLEPH